MATARVVVVIYALFHPGIEHTGSHARPHPCRRWSPLIKLPRQKRTQIFLALGVLQLLLAGAALAYFVYLKSNANTAESVGLVVNKAISKQQQSTGDLQLLRAPSSSVAANETVLAEQEPLIGGALTKLVAFQRPDQPPKPAESPDCVHYRVVPNSDTYYPGKKITLELKILRAPRDTEVKGFVWSIDKTNGFIESGQGTRSITIDTTKSSGTIDWELNFQIVSFSNTPCRVEVARPVIREVPAPTTPTPAPNKVQRFEGGLDFGQNVPPSKAGITVKGYLGGPVVETTTDQLGRFSFETDRRGRFFFSFSSGGRQHKGQDIDLVDGKSDLGLISIDVGPLASPSVTPSPSVSPTPSISPSVTPTPTATPTTPTPTAEVISTQKADTGEFSVNWPRALMRNEEGVVTVTYTPPKTGEAPQLPGRYSQIQIQLSAVVDGLILLGEPDTRRFATLGGEPITWSYPVRVKEEAGSTTTCDISLELTLTSETGNATSLPAIPLASAQIAVPTIPPVTWLVGSSVVTPSGLATLGLGLFPGKPRYVNTRIVDDEKQTIPANTELGTDRSYYVRINIGPLSKETIVRNPLPFPSGLLPQGKGGGHWLDAVVASDDFQFDKHRYTFFLPGKGPSWVCECNPDAPHTCSKKTREDYLDIAIEPVRVTSHAKLRLSIYYANNVIQSQLITVAIAETEREGQEFSSTIDYTLAKSLDSLNSFPARTLNILTNDNEDGTHKIIINGKLDDAIVFNFTEGQMTNAIGAVRDKLRDLHIVKYGGHLGAKEQIKSRYDQNNAKPKAEFVKDLKELATCGWLLWQTLFKNQLEKGRELKTKLLKDPGTIQVSRVHGSEFVFPWGAIYDIPLESNPELFRTCRLIDEWQGAETLINWDRPECPYGDTHTRNTICPFGFWGFKHIIEQLPSMPKGRDVQRTIKISKRPIELLTALSLDLDSKLSENHLQELESKLSSAVKVVPYRSRKEIETALSHPQVELIYFYCHGGRAELPGSSSPTPFLGIGKDERLTTGDLVAWSFDWGTAHWVDTSPLVFINGCHTAEITPESLVNFVDTFVGVFAAGVIGTEIVLDQRIANEAGATFFYYFKDQKCSVGTALQHVRRTLLLKGNLLGLVYTSYCAVDLHLS